MEIKLKKWKYYKDIKNCFKDVKGFKDLKDVFHINKLHLYT